GEQPEGLEPVAGDRPEEDAHLLGVPVVGFLRPLDLRRLRSGRRIPSQVLLLRRHRLAPCGSSSLSRFWTVVGPIPGAAPAPAAVRVPAAPAPASESPRVPSLRARCRTRLPSTYAGVTLNSSSDQSNPTRCRSAGSCQRPG